MDNKFIMNLQFFIWLLRLLHVIFSMIDVDPLRHGSASSSLPLRLSVASGHCILEGGWSACGCWDSLMTKTCTTNIVIHLSKYHCLGFTMGLNISHVDPHSRSIYWRSVYQGKLWYHRRHHRYGHRSPSLKPQSLQQAQQAAGRGLRTKPILCLPILWGVQGTRKPGWFGHPRSGHKESHDRNQWNYTGPLPHVLVAGGWQGSPW